MSSSPVVVLGTPCYGGMVSHVYMQSVIRLMMYASSRNISINLALSAHDSLITRSRNSIVAAFLDMPAATHLMFIDADISFEAEAVERMLAFDEEVVAGMYPLKVIHWPQAVAQITPESSVEDAAQAGLKYVGLECINNEREERGEFVTGVYAGTGFMLIKRSAIEKMVAAYPETKYNTIQTYPTPAVRSQNQYSLFDCIIDPKTGIYLSEDFTFCHRWRACGGKLWLDRLSKLTHVGSYEFVGNLAHEAGARA